jgi:hypothetical protein
MNSTAPLPPVIPVVTLAKWLPEIFPEGTPNRNYAIREMAAKTIFVLFYVGAVEGMNRYARPDQVTKMNDLQADQTGVVSRQEWTRDSLLPGKLADLAERWYAPNTREPIRDETLRNGLVALGAGGDRSDLPTTSAKPRYALAGDFAELLLQLSLEVGNHASLISELQAKHLTSAALSRVKLLRQGVVHTTASGRVKVTFPNGEVRLMHPGPSTTIAKAVVEEFARRFLREPGLVFLSESGDKVVVRDEALAHSMGLRLDYSRNLPDIILVDAHPQSPKLVFVEVVATDGAVTEQRKRALLQVASEAGFDQRNVFFLTAFLDRTAPAFRKLVAEIAWGTFAWFAAEPDKLLVFREGHAAELTSLFNQ